MTDCWRNRAVGNELDILVGVQLNTSQQGILILKKASHALQLLRVRMASVFERSYCLLDTDENTQELLCANVAPCLKHSVE